MKSGLLPSQLNGLTIRSLEGSLRSHPTPPSAWFNPPEPGSRTLPLEACFTASVGGGEIPRCPRLLIAMPHLFSGSCPLILLLLCSLSLITLLKWRLIGCPHLMKEPRLFLLILGQQKLSHFSLMVFNNLNINDGNKATVIFLCACLPSTSLGADVLHSGSGLCLFSNDCWTGKSPSG